MSPSQQGMSTGYTTLWGPIYVIKKILLVSYDIQSRSQAQR